MKKLVTALLFAIPAGLLAWSCYLVLSGPTQPYFGWQSQMSAAEHDTILAVLGHKFTVAAFAVTWAIQLGYLAWLWVKWGTEKRNDPQNHGRSR
jgi:hypothetical protein